MSAVIGRIWSPINRLAERFPLGFSVAYGGAKTVAADALVQKYMEDRKELDWRRQAIFALFGCFQVGFVQYQIYVNAFTRLFPTAAQFSAKSLSAKATDIAGLRNLGAQVLLDQCVYHPLCYFPVFYTCKELIESGGVPGPSTIPRAIANYVPNAIEDLKALWTIFVPTSIIQFSMMPMHLRVPFTATVGFAWCGILSMMRGAHSAPLPTDEPPSREVAPTARLVRRATGELLTPSKADAAPSSNANVATASNANVATTT